MLRVQADHGDSARVVRRRAYLIATVVVATLLWGCRQAPATGDAASPSATIRPSGTATPTAALPAATATQQPMPTQTPLPTPTMTATATGTPTPTPQPTVTPCPTSPSPTPTISSPTITSFEAEVEIADPGDTVTLCWTSSGATSATLAKMLVSGQLPANGIDVATSGCYGYEIPLADQNWATFLLYVEGPDALSAYATATVRLRCTYAWFFEPVPEDICPTEPLISAAAQQRFERGVMLWVAAEDAVYVLLGAPTTTTRWTRYQDSWREGMPDRDPELTPPPGLQQPIRGFGLVWRENEHVREQLGWAVESEQGYTTVKQRTTRYKYNAWYVLARDGSVWHLGPERSSWDTIVPGALLLQP